MKRVLCILENGFEEIEMITPVDLLRRAGVEVVLAGVSNLELTGRSGITVKADSLFPDVAEERFDALFLPGGPAVMELRNQESVIALIRSFHEAGLLIAAICAAPLLLKDAGLVDGKRITAHFSTEDELPGNTGERFIYDGEFLTSRGAGTALDFGFEFVRILTGKETAESVFEAVMA